MSLRPWTISWASIIMKLIFRPRQVTGRIRGKAAIWAEQEGRRLTSGEIATKSSTNLVAVPAFISGEWIPLLHLPVTGVELPPDHEK